MDIFSEIILRADVINERRACKTFGQTRRNSKTPDQKFFEGLNAALHKESTDRLNGLRRALGWEEVPIAH